MALLHFREIDVSTTKGKAKLTDTFINKIFVYDDKIKIIYNVNGEEENITLEELESSSFEQYAQPKNFHDKCGVLYSTTLLAVDFYLPFYKLTLVFEFYKFLIFFNWFTIISNE